MAWRALWVAVLFFCARAHAQVPGLPIVDFERYFPHMTAVSDELKNTQWPRGVQWKFVSVRDEKEKVVTLALIRREGRERIVRLMLAKGPIETSEEGMRALIAEVSEDQGIRFDVADLRDVRTFDAFKEKAGAAGWGMQALPNKVER